MSLAGKPGARMGNLQGQTFIWQLAANDVENNQRILKGRRVG
jgi:hypothetical protein